MQGLQSSLVKGMATANAPSIGLSRGIKWVFPLGAILNVSGVFLCALLEWHSLGNTQDWRFAVLSNTFFPSLLVGTALVMIGSFLDRQRLPARQARRRGILCWVVSAVSFSLLASLGNVHSWTFTFIFPAFTGLIAGIIFLS